MSDPLNDMDHARLEDLQIEVLKKLIDAGDKGVSRFDFPEHLGLDEETLALVIASLELGVDTPKH